MRIKGLAILLLSAAPLICSAEECAVSKSETSPSEKLHKSTEELQQKVDDFNTARYRENAVEFSVESANLFSIGHKLNYWVAPQMLTMHWHLDDVGNPDWRRGNTVWTTSALISPVINGPENRMFGIVFGPRYNFVQPNWKWVPFVESRVGVCFVDAQPVMYSQGQDFCFTFMVGVGTRYDFDENLSLSLEALYQHISNAGLSEPDRPNHGLDIIGPNVSLMYRF